jgi:hypothetical protein
MGAGWHENKGDFSNRPSGIFSQAGLDDPNHIESAGEISFYAQIMFGPWSPSGCIKMEPLAVA